MLVEVLDGGLLIGERRATSCVSGKKPFACPCRLGQPMSHAVPTPYAEPWPMRGIVRMLLSALCIDQIPAPAQSRRQHRNCIQLLRVFVASENVRFS